MLCQRFHPASRQIDKEQDEEAPQASSGPDLHTEEVCGYDQFPVSRQKLLPSRLLAPLWRRLDPAPIQNISDCAASQLVSKIGYGTLDAAITPGTVFFRQANNQSLYFFSGAGASWSALLMPVVLFRDQFTVPSQQGIGCNQVATSARSLRPALWLEQLNDGAGHH
jgi:hypothetical protein